MQHHLVLPAPLPDEEKKLFLEKYTYRKFTIFIPKTFSMPDCFECDEIRETTDDDDATCEDHTDLAYGFWKAPDDELRKAMYEVSCDVYASDRDEVLTEAKEAIEAIYDQRKYMREMDKKVEKVVKAQRLLKTAIEAGKVPKPVVAALKTLGVIQRKSATVVQ